MNAKMTSDCEEVLRQFRQWLRDEFTAVQKRHRNMRAVKSSFEYNEGCADEAERILSKLYKLEGKPFGMTAGRSATTVLDRFGGN